jgi:hypothetical protein
MRGTHKIESIDWSHAKTLVGARGVREQRLLVEVHPAEEVLIEVKLLVFGGRHHGADKGLHRFERLLAHHGDHALLRGHGLKRPADDPVHDRPRVARGADLAGELVEHRELFERASEAQILFLQSLELDRRDGRFARRRLRREGVRDLTQYVLLRHGPRSGMDGSAALVGTFPHGASRRSP